MHVADRLPLVAPDAPMSEAIVVMSACSFGCVGVVGPDGVLAGVLTDGDLRRHMSPDLLARPAAEIMTPRPKRSEEHTSELQSLMRISYAVFCLKKKQHPHNNAHNGDHQQN